MILKNHDIFLFATFIWQNYKKWFHQIISHNQTYIISKNLYFSIYFSLRLINFFDFDHSALFMSPKSIKCSLVEWKSNGSYDIYDHKNLKKLKKKTFHLFNRWLKFQVKKGWKCSCFWWNSSSFLRFFYLFQSFNYTTSVNYFCKTLFIHYRVRYFWI